MVPTNFLAVLVGGIVATVVGGLWYGPLFGKDWSRIAGITEQKMADAKKNGMGKLYAVQFVGALVTSYVLFHSVVERNITNPTTAVVLAFWIWLGFIAATTSLASVTWEGKPMKFYWINTLYYLVVFCINAIIFAYWH